MIMDPSTVSYVCIGSHVVTFGHSAMLNMNKRIWTAIYARLIIGVGGEGNTGITLKSLGYALPMAPHL